MDSRLTSFQRELALAFGKRAPDFFLTGGAALVGFYLGHRTTLDLDWFTTGDHLEAGEAALRSAAEELGATIEAIQSSPDHRRRVVRRGAESIEYAPQVISVMRLRRLGTVLGKARLPGCNGSVRIISAGHHVENLQKTRLHILGE